MQNFVKSLEAIVRQAGAELLSRRPGSTGANLKIITKPDGSPVTDADLMSHDIILDGLSKLAPGEMIISEESVPSDPLNFPSDCWFVDPLDGTKPFINGADHFAVFVGHRSGMEFDLGMMFFPARNELIVGGRGVPATLNGVSLNPNRDSSIRLGSVALHYADATICERWISDTKYPSRTRTYVDVWRGVLDAAIGRYSGGSVDLWDVSASLAILQSLGVSAVNYDGTTPKVSGTKLVTEGLIVASSEKIEMLLHALTVLPKA